MEPAKVNVSVRKQVLKSSEKLVKATLDELVELAEVYSKETDSPVDDKVVDGVKLLRKVFLDGLIDKISEDV